MKTSHHRSPVPRGLFAVSRVARFCRNTLLAICTVGFVAIASPVASAATWYGQPTTAGYWDSLTNWFSQPLTGGTNPAAMLTTDDFDMNGFGLLTRNVTGTNTLSCAHLIIRGGAVLSLRTNPPNSVKIPAVISYGGKISCDTGVSGCTVTIPSFVNTAWTTLSAGSVTDKVTFAITTLSGSGDICCTGGSGTGKQVSLLVTTATGFSGIVYVDDNCHLEFAGNMASGGALVLCGSNSSCILTATATVKGLTINNVVKAPGTYTAAQLGSQFSGPGQLIVQAANAPVVPPVTTMFGVNFSGSEAGIYPVEPNFSYYWDYYAGKQLNLIRIPFSWERIQPALNGPLNATVLANLDNIVNAAGSRGMSVILDLHNYAKYNGVLLTSTGTPSYANLQNVWQQLAAHFNGNQAVYGYDLMNEPTCDIATWNGACQAAINGVRTGDTGHPVFVEGVNWSHAEGWAKTNATLNVTDSGNNIIYSAHSYFSKSGNDTFLSYDAEHEYPYAGVDHVAQFVNWLRLKNARGHIGEFGVPNTVASPDYRWNLLLDKFYSNLNANQVMGTEWGTFNFGNTYTLKTNLSTGTTITDAPCMAVLQNYGGVDAGFSLGLTDIGVFTPAGTEAYANGTYTVTSGNGVDFNRGYTSDKFTYLNQGVAGDCSIIARVTSLNTSDHSYGEGAVMIRESLTTGCVFAAMGIGYAGTPHFTCRLTTGAANVDAQVSPNITFPYWVKIVRSGNSFSGYASSNGTTWTQVGTAQTIPMAGAATLGLAVCDHGATVTPTATFDHVTATP